LPYEGLNPQPPDPWCRQVVQERPLRSKLWADIPELSTCIGRGPVAWLQSRGGTALIPDRLLLRPDIFPVGTDRATVMRCRRSLMTAVGCCCCCHRCCQRLVLFPISAVRGRTPTLPPACSRPSNRSYPCGHPDTFRSVRDSDAAGSAVRARPANQDVVRPLGSSVAPIRFLRLAPLRPGPRRHHRDRPRLG
jgi:hypothetical protein